MSVPEPTETATLVQSQFELSRTNAQELIDDARDYIQSFAATYVTPALVDVEWVAVAAPEEIVIPEPPAGLDDTDGFDIVLPDTPEPLVLEEIDLEFSSFDETAPTLDLSGRPELEFPEAPDMSVGAVPTVPDPASPDLPTVPELGDVAAPTLLELSTPSIEELDLRQDWLDTLEAIPELTLLTPTAFSYSPSAKYTSTLTANISSILTARLAGGTGLNPTVEAGIWSRGADRASKAMQADVDDALNAHEAFGWSLPSPAVIATQRRAVEKARASSADTAREVAIKQADLEQTNLREAVQQALTWEGTLIDQALRMEMLGFETAKALAENTISIYNARVESYKAVLSAYELRARVYDTIIKGELAKVEVFKGLVDAEKTKAEVNKVLVEQYQAELDARLAVVRLYEAQLQGARTFMEVEKAKIEAAGEQVRAFVAGVNAKLAQAEIYKATVSAQGIKAEAWGKDIQAQLGAVEVYKAKATAFQAVTGAEAERARAQVARITGLATVKAEEYRGYAAGVDAQRAKVGAAGERARALVSSYDAKVRAIEGKSSLEIKSYEAQVAQYKATQEYVINGTRLNLEIINNFNNAQLEASKIGAQVHAQMAASMLGTAHVSSALNENDGTQIQVSYQG